MRSRTYVGWLLIVTGCIAGNAWAAETRSPKIDASLAKVLDEGPVNGQLVVGRACSLDADKQRDDLIVSFKDPYRITGSEYPERSATDGRVRRYEILRRSDAARDPTVVRLILVRVPKDAAVQDVRDLAQREEVAHIAVNCSIRVHRDITPVDADEQATLQVPATPLSGPGTDCRNDYQPNSMFGIPLGNQRCARIDAAWATGLKGAAQTVAVMDSGFNCRHPVLGQNVVGVPPLTGPGYCNDSNGLDAVAEDGNPDDEFIDVSLIPPAARYADHGTTVAAVVAGRKTSGALTCEQLGAAPEARLMSVRVTSGDRVEIFDLVHAVKQAALRGATILNFSVLWWREDLDAPRADEHPLIGNAIAEIGALEFGLGRGVLVVAGASSNHPEPAKLAYPAAYGDQGNILGVAYLKTNYIASNPSKNYADLPNSTLAALSERVQSAQTHPQEACGGGYTGASLGTPLVAAAAALLWSHPKFNRCTASQLRAALFAGSALANRNATWSAQQNGGTTTGTLPLLDLSFLQNPTATAAIANTHCPQPIPNPPTNVYVDGMGTSPP